MMRGNELAASWGCAELLSVGGLWSAPVLAKPELSSTAGLDLVCAQVHMHHGPRASRNT